VKEVHSKLVEHMKNAPPSDISSTFVPYYDSILDEAKKSNIGEIKMSSTISDKVKN
jgi:hypothetical protein